MSNQAAKLFAGQMGVCAVIVNVLIDKGIITQREIRKRFEQARIAACQCSEGPIISHALAEIVKYLEPEDEVQGRVVADRPRLDGEVILVVEEQPVVAGKLQTVLEEAGAEVLLATSRRKIPAPNSCGFDS
jgi:hypothetical protein